MGCSLGIPAMLDDAARLAVVLDCDRLIKAELARIEQHAVGMESARRDMHIAVKRHGDLPWGHMNDDATAAADAAMVRANAAYEAARDAYAGAVAASEIIVEHCRARATAAGVVLL